ncbi:MAG: uncharacterized protein QG600_107 [Patescibacteria group bacterium]|jgi:uncharacterized membrane protein (UPF0127 family)|nr:uncharacterized protein [Patescibacteria group bacterium]
MSLNKILLIIVIAIIIIAGIVVFLASSSVLKDSAEVKFGDDTFALEIADSDKERQIGLSEKKSLGEKKGMIFLFPESTIPAFWMKGMDFPIDIIFVNGNKVVSIFKDVPAPKNETDPLPNYQPSSPIDRVIEVPAGTVDKYDIKEGDEITISL